LPRVYLIAWLGELVRQPSRIYTAAAVEMFGCRVVEDLLYRSPVLFSPEFQRGGASSEAIFELLTEIRVKSLELPACPEKDRAISAKLVVWWKHG